MPYFQVRLLVWSQYHTTARRGGLLHDRRVSVTTVLHSFKAGIADAISGFTLGQMFIFAKNIHSLNPLIR